MSSLKEIRRRIGSVKNTKQITRAMKLVSAAKLRRAQEAAEGGRSFGQRLAEVLKTVSSDLPEATTHPLLETREEVRRRCLIVIAGERGLCGAYNTNVIKAVNAEIKKSAEPIEIIAVGRRAVSAGKRFSWNLLKTYESLPEEVASWPTSEMAELVMQRFTDGECDAVDVLFTQFVSAMTQTVTQVSLLPFVPPEESSDSLSEQAEGSQASAVDEAALLRGKTKYDPAPTAILHGLLPLLVKTQVCQAALESKASEHGARMTAMDSATRNADDLMDTLQLFYNRARQSAITTELIDIVGGAEAQN